jgi:hypothetical protein
MSLDSVYSKMKLGVRLGFETYAPTILGTSFENCTPVALLDYATATALGYDPSARHINIFTSSARKMTTVPIPITVCSFRMAPMTS